MEMAAAEEGKQRTWNEGWPQPGESEKGNGGGEVKGGHEILASGGDAEQECDNASVAKNGVREIRERKAAAAAAGGGGMVVERKW